MCLLHLGFGRSRKCYTGRSEKTGKYNNSVGSVIPYYPCSIETMENTLRTRSDRNEFTAKIEDRKPETVHTPMTQSTDRCNNLEERIIYYFGGIYDGIRENF